MKKIEKGRQFVTEHLTLFRCLVCDQPYDHLNENSLVCVNGHQIDLNKRGSLVFLNHAVNTEYDDKMLAARRRVLAAGLFDGIIDAVGRALPDTPQTLLDVGTGEGTPLMRLLERRQVGDTAVGFDISKAGINLATQLTTDAFFTVADLAQLPFNDQSFDSVIEFFSPSAYREFNRVAKPNGHLVKVIPASGYLKELREMLYPTTSENHTYDNTRVRELFAAHYPDMTSEHVTYSWTIPMDLWVDLLHMTPLHWGARPEAQAAAEQKQLTQVTVDVLVLSTNINKNI
ncbi:methyltransferase domain-containing protein [Weissella diestrammenae]|uniref:Methyltransferase domain-containing protein n=1 Tax=Weissella diestrammenae TaxID=1162633 RepID=A0A7G9T6W8_9LACO|nr:methyltransferase domain-containing protein [Weissella diestrammenae]MCM0582563.1 methyltransferase domain-containing protein [Weissella diestrammenae]QNN75843.1 methyltransferase domain-containing protein [Weissella diestrammenae]